jgi:hypothetical protein
VGQKLRLTVRRMAVHHMVGGDVVWVGGEEGVANP